ncbi:MAG: hypothetical protein KAR40_05120 [Candidatus Sabulitectum sp.]|nr:hypothetical protein [Candidatus Sabulitectum sp.]
MTAFILIFLAGFSPIELEQAGMLAEAGAAWEEEENLAGQVRIMGRLIEEAIYAGDGIRAVLLSLELQNACRDQDLNDFWMARIAWTSGLSEYAVEALMRMSPTDPWLFHRARGLSALFQEDGRKAVDELTLSIAAASTARKAFWSAIDLCSAYLTLGMYEEALHLSRLIRIHYSGDALGDVMYGLCLQVSGRFGESSRVLNSVDSSNPAAEFLARSIMEGFEQ